MPHGLFITGTDTGVGKTRVGTALAHLLAAGGATVRVRKPVESGCAGGLPADAEALRQAAGGHERLEAVCPIRLAAALSPERAAVREGRPLPLAELIAACRSGIGGDDTVLVEGAGGFFSPIADNALNADLARALGLPVLIVVADRLGAINQTLLTVEAIEKRALPLAGIVLNTIVAPTEDGIDNACDLERWTGRPVLRFRALAPAGQPSWLAESAQLAALAQNDRLFRAGG